MATAGVKTVDFDPGVAVDEFLGNANGGTVRLPAGEAAGLMQLRYARDDVAAILADTSLTLTIGSLTSVAVGDYLLARKEALFFQVAASAATDHDVTTAGGLKLYTVAGAAGTVANAFSATLDHSAVAAAMGALGRDSLPTLSNLPKKSTAVGHVVCTAPIEQSFPDFGNIHIDHTNAVFEAQHDGVLFDLNPNVDWANINTQRLIKFFGGSYENTNAAATASVCFRMFGLRVSKIEDGSFIGWHKAIEIQGKDTYIIRDTYFRKNVHDIYCPAGLVQNGGDVLLRLSVEDCHFSVVSDTSNPKYSHGPVYIDDRIVNFSFVRSSINGAAPPAAQIYHANNYAAKPSRTLNITESHFEQIGQYGAIYLKGNTGGIENVTIEKNDFQQVYDGAERTIRLDNVNGANINKNKFEANGEVSPGVPITVVRGIHLDALCKNIRIGLDNIWQGAFTNKISLNGCPRSEVTIGSGGLRKFDPELLSNLSFGGDARTTGTGVLALNDATLGWSHFSELWLPPKRYRVRLTASDSGSASGSAYAMIHAGTDALGAGTQATGIKVYLNGLPNGTEVTVEGDIDANDVGNLKYDLLSTGAGTLNVWVTIIGVYE